MRLTKAQVKQLIPLAEDFEEGTINNGTYVSVWMRDSTETYFFEKTKLLGISLEFNGKRSFIGVCK